MISTVIRGSYLFSEIKKKGLRHYHMDKMLSTRIKHKRDTHMNWSDRNPILLDGEMIIVDHEEGLKLKIGNGIDRYNSLSFYGNIYAERPSYHYTEIVGLVDRINTIAVIPSGMIMIWSGSQGNIPDGWVLCDGSNNTPDLTDKFVLGAGNTYSVGSIGGESEHTLTIDEIPSHTHRYKRHAFNNNDTGEVLDESVYGVSNKTIDSYLGLSESTGGGLPHNNMPPYYALCYIMKT